MSRWCKHEGGGHGEGDGIRRHLDRSPRTRRALPRPVDSGLVRGGSSSSSGGGVGSSSSSSRCSRAGHGNVLSGGRARERGQRRRGGEQGLLRGVKGGVAEHRGTGEREETPGRGRGVGFLFSLFYLSYLFFSFSLFLFSFSSGKRNSQIWREERVSKRNVDSGLWTCKKRGVSWTNKGFINSLLLTKKRS